MMLALFSIPLGIPLLQLGEDVKHCYDWSVPPAEEVLTMKLVLEHAENWIRNASGCLSGHEDIYRNPFMSDRKQGADGLPDAAFMRGIGRAFRSLLTGR